MSDKKVQLTVVVRQMMEDKVEFFLNSKLEPTVHVPDDGFQQDWPADSQRIQDLLNANYYDATKGILKTGEREFLLSQIREECRKGGRRLTEVEAEETDQDVIVQAILYFVNSHEQFDDLTAVLLGKLRNDQADGKFSQLEEIPIFTNIFSRRLRRLIPVLREYGVDVTLDHREDGSHCRITRMDEFAVEPEASLVQSKEPDGSKQESSGEPSGASPRKGKDLQTADGADGEIRYDSPDEKTTRTAEPAKEAEPEDKPDQASTDSTVEEGGAQ